MSVTVLVPEDLQPTVDKVNNLQQSDVAQNAKLVADEAVLSGHTQALTDLSTRVANLETKLISDEQKIADVNTRLTGVETQVNANVAAIGGLLQKVTNLEAVVSANSLKIADLTNTISPLKDQIADLLTYKDRIADLENAFPAPVMTFTADKTTVNAGESVVLSWDTKNVWRVTLNDQDAVKTGGIPVTPDKNTDYTLVAYGPKDFVVKTISITVNFPAPTLTASINPTSLVSGQPATITWATTNADKVSINNVDAPINGTQTVTPTANTDYLVVATGKGGTVNQKVSITVTQPAPTATISVAPNIITAGGSATLTWSSTNADTVNIEVVTNGVSSNLLGLAASGSMSVNPAANTNYNLSVTGAGGNATASTTLTVNAVPAPISALHFDFGTQTSPVAAGYTKVDETTKYSSAQGYGWLSGTVTSRDRGIGGDLTRDFNFGNNIVFVVDLPNDNYDVTVTMGDATTAHDNMGIFIEDIQVDSITVAANQFITKTYTVAVKDGQLTLLFKDLGGTDTSVVINALDIVKTTATRAVISLNPSSIIVGQTSTLTWQAVNATSATLDGVNVELSGSKTVNPTSNTTYTLVAIGNTTDTSSISLAVNPNTVLTDIIDNNGNIVTDLVYGNTYTLRGQSLKFNQNSTSVRVGLGTGTLGMIGTIKSFTDTEIVFTVPSNTNSFINTVLNFYWSVNGLWTLKGSLPLTSINIVNNPPSVSGMRDSLRNPATTLNGGTTAYVQGNYLGGSGTVTLAGLPVTVVKWTNTEITVSLPVVLEQTTGSVVVTRSDNQVGSLSGFTLLVSAPTATLTLNPTSMLVGASSTLTWSSSGATQVTIDPIGAVALSGSQTVAPTVTTAYNLTATGPGGVKTLSQTLTVNVPPPPPVPPPAIVGANIPHPKMDMTNVNWPTHLNYTYSAVVGSNTMGFDMFQVAVSWLTVPDGWVGQYKASSTTTIAVTKQMLKDWCIKKWREKMDSIMTKWNANLNVTDFASDSYLYCGDNINALLTVASWMGDALTDAEKSNMQMVIEQAVWNTWNPTKAMWGTTKYTWTGWGTNNPLNNYFYRSHWRGTMLWAIYSQSATWLDFVRNNLNPLVKTKYASLVGGGSYEGTGYGQSYTDLFKVALLWKNATGEDMTVDIHIPEHIEYWVRAITPDGTCYWPVGDQASGSGPYPGMRDGLKNLILWGILAAPTCPQAELGRWLLNKVGKKLGRPEQCINGCYNTDGVMTAPVGDSYYASAVGHLFAKADDGSYIGVKAGPSIESHDSSSEGSIDLYLPGGWRMVTSNIFTTSGIEQRTKFYNCMWFKKADGTDIVQKRVRGTTLNYTDVNSVLNGTIDSTAVYVGTDVTSCKRDFIYDRPNKKISIHDTYATINGATGSCQLGFNALPVLNADNSVTVGPLTLRCSNPGVVINIADFNTIGGTNSPVGKAWYVNFSGCAEYNIEVTW